MKWLFLLSLFSFYWIKTFKWCCFLKMGSARLACCGVAGISCICKRNSSYYTKALHFLSSADEGEDTWYLPGHHLNPGGSLYWPRKIDILSSFHRDRSDETVSLTSHHSTALQLTAITPGVATFQLLSCDWLSRLLSQVFTFYRYQSRTESPEYF